MKKAFLFMALMSCIVWADDGHKAGRHSHEGDVLWLVDGTALEVDTDRFNRFVEGLSDAQIAVVSVHGLVCDFCARGIEKTFGRDKSVMKIEVDLKLGKVLVAYRADKQIDFEDIKEKILVNGQNATGLKILKL